MSDPTLTDLTVHEFLDRLASGNATPGGGAAAALAGAMAAALVSMVCNLTTGRERYAEWDAQARQIQAEAATLMTQLREGVQEDADTFDGVMAAYKLPRGTEDEKAARTAAIQAATRLAALAPLGLVEAGARLIELADQAVGKTNPNLASDLSVAALLGMAAIDSASANVEINLASLHDEAIRTEIAGRLTAARDGRREQAARVVERTKS